MLRVPPRLTAALLGLAVPGLLAAAGLTASTPLTGVAAQEAAPEAAQEGRSGRRGRRGRRERAGRKSETSGKLPPGMQQAAPVATFGDWNVFTNSQQGRARVCYAIAQPQTRTPKSLARDTAYLFVSVRKGENVQNEIAVMFGFKPKPAASQEKPGASAASKDPHLLVDRTRYGLVVKDENGWVQNQAEEAKIVAEMGKAQSATVKTTSARGNPTTDEYALGGFGEAVKRAREECK